MRQRVLKPALCLVLAFFACVAPANQPAKAFKIVLDPGHSLAAPGALGVRAVHEVNYNNVFAAELARALQAAGVQVLVTRQPGEEITLDQRTEIANTSGADLFLSLHHDSAQLRYLQPITVNNMPAWRSTIALQGYSIFVSAVNPLYETSLEFAKAIALRLHALGRKPALHHAEKIPGEGRELLDARLGVYRFDELLVLRKTKIPAVLLEVGVIVDEDDEAYVKSAENRAAMISAIVSAVGSSSKH